MRPLIISLCTGAALATLPAISVAQDQQPTEAAQRQTPDIPTIAMGSTVNSNIAQAAAGCANDPRIKMWRFEGQANQRLEITMQSEAFDTVIEIGRMTGCEFTALAANDDGGGPEDGLNSRLTVRLREAGNYVIRARAFSEDGAGDFAVAMRALPPPAAEPAPMMLTPGREARGRLTAADPTIPGAEETIAEGGRPYHLYTLTGAAGQTYNLALDSSDFDPVIEAGSLGPLGYSTAAFNDDGGGEDDGLNSRLAVTFRTAGTIVLRITPLGGGTGSYRLRATAADQ